MSGEAMTEPTFLVLVALAAGRLHGYGVMQAVAGHSGGRVRLRPGTVYGVLDRLQRDGLIGEDGVEIQQGRERRYYRITPSGLAALVAETERLSANVRAARGQVRLALRP